MDFREIIGKLWNNDPLEQAEMEALLEWLLTAKGREQFEREVERNWHGFDSDAPFDYEKVLGRLNARIDSRERMLTVRRRRRHRLSRYLAEALAVVAVLAGVIFIVREEVVPLFVDEGAELVVIYNPHGLRTSVVLPDSSTVILNADSRITYPRTFTRRERKVTLTGEAYFNVAHNPERPFVVDAGISEMTVLGTSFNVRAYDNEKFVTTSLVEGGLYVKAGWGKNILDPGRQILVDRESKAMKIGDFDVSKVTGWMEGKLYFESVTFGEIANTLGRNFNVRIEIRDPALAQKMFTGKFVAGENLDQILDVINFSASFSRSHDKDNNIIIIH